MPVPSFITQPVEKSHFMGKPAAALSIDLDNLWTYLKVHGRPNWDKFPSYFNDCIPIILNWLQQHQLTVTFFVVGRDGTQEEHCRYWQQIAAAGHEIGNHSFNHEPWMIFENPFTIHQEIYETHQLIEKICGNPPRGFRGPGFCHSLEILRCLKDLDYQYDASVFPSLIGPLARLYFLPRSAMSRKAVFRRRSLFGRFRDGFYSLKPFFWKLPNGELIELPITTLPGLRLPIHFSYLFALAEYAPPFASLYLKLALFLCRRFSVAPSFLLHPPDFLSGETIPQLAFLPGMNLPQSQKLKMLNAWLREIQTHFDIIPLIDQAQKVSLGGQTKVMQPYQPLQIV